MADLAGSATERKFFTVLELLLTIVIILILLTMTLPLAGKILRQVRIIAGKEASSHL